MSRSSIQPDDEPLIDPTSVVTPVINKGTKLSRWCASKGCAISIYVAFLFSFLVTLGMALWLASFSAFLTRSWWMWPALVSSLLCLLPLTLKTVTLAYFVSGKFDFHKGLWLSFWILVTDLLLLTTVIFYDWLGVCIVSPPLICNLLVVTWNAVNRRTQLVAEGHKLPDLDPVTSEPGGWIGIYLLVFVSMAANSGVMIFTVPASVIVSALVVLPVPLKISPLVIRCCGKFDFQQGLFISYVVLLLDIVSLGVLNGLSSATIPFFRDNLLSVVTPVQCGALLCDLLMIAWGLANYTSVVIHDDNEENPETAPKKCSCSPALCVIDFIHAIGLLLYGTCIAMLVILYMWGQAAWWVIFLGVLLWIIPFVLKLTLIVFRCRDKITFRIGMHLSGAALLSGLLLFGLLFAYLMNPALFLLGNLAFAYLAAGVLAGGLISDLIILLWSCVNREPSL